MGREKYTLLWILSTRTYKIYKEGVDNDNEAADNFAVPCRQKRSRTTFFCQPLSAQFYRKPRDRDIHRHTSLRRAMYPPGKTVPMSVAVFLCFHSGLNPGG